MGYLNTCLRKQAGAVAPPPVPKVDPAVAYHKRMMADYPETLNSMLDSSEKDPVKMQEAGKTHLTQKYQKDLTGKADWMGFGAEEAGRGYDAERDAYLKLPQADRDKMGYPTVDPGTLSPERRASMLAIMKAKLGVQPTPPVQPPPASGWFGKIKGAVTGAVSNAANSPAVQSALLQGASPEFGRQYANAYDTGTAGMCDLAAKQVSDMRWGAVKKYGPYAAGGAGILGLLALMGQDRQRRAKQRQTNPNEWSANKNWGNY